MLNKMEEGELGIYCKTTGEELFIKLPNGKEIRTKSHGKCFDCDDWFSIEALRTAEGMSMAKWPIRYVGYSCKACYNKPSSSDEI